MAHGKRYTLEVDLQTDDLGSFTLSFRSDDHQTLEDFMVISGIAVGRLVPNARMMGAGMRTYCLDCGTESEDSYVRSDCGCAQPSA
jgi:hypothetical protein